MIIKEHDKTEANTDSKSKKITLYFRLVKMNTHMTHWASKVLGKKA